MKCFVFFTSFIFVSYSFDCPSSNWFRFRNKCYLTEESKYYTFQENLDFCQSQEATTVSIHSKEENDFLNTKLHSNQAYWLGIRQIDFDAKTYAWIDGSIYNYSNWDYRGGNKNCAGADVHKGQWRDWKNCSDLSSAFCQINFDSSVNNLRSQLQQMSQSLMHEIGAIEIRVAEDNIRLKDSINKLKALMIDLQSTIQKDY